MKCTLVFAADDPKRDKKFLMCCTAVLNGGDGKGERSRAVTRKEAKLLDALDAISVPHPDRSIAEGGGPDSRVLKPGTQTFTLDGEVHTLLQQYLNTCLWTPRSSREARDAQDWADKPQQVEE